MENLKHLLLNASMIPLAIKQNRLVLAICCDSRSRAWLGLIRIYQVFVKLSAMIF